MQVQIKRVHRRASIPQYQTAGAAGFDLQACLAEGVEIVVPRGWTVRIPTGIAVSIGNPCWALDIMARSGLASKGISVANGVGLVDSDYQGEVGVLLHNRSDGPFTVRHGDRIAQGRFVPVGRASFVEVDAFSQVTERGERGFGSTGL